MDSDGDGLSDLEESGGSDVNGDGSADELVLGAAVADLDGDGTPDLLQAQGVIVTGLTGSGCSIASVNRSTVSDPTLPLFALVAFVYLGLLRRKKAMLQGGVSQ